MSQKSRILDYLKTGKRITPMTALDRFGCFRLSERIRELERAGHTINHTWYRLGNKKFMSYKLMP